MQIGVSLGLSQPWTASGGADGTFVMSDLSPTVWLASQDATTITTAGGTLSAWSNKGSLGGSASQGTTAAQPDYATTGWPNDTTKPTVTFKGSDDILDLTTLSSTVAAFTMAMVLRPTSLSDLGFGIAGNPIGCSVASDGLQVGLRTDGQLFFAKQRVADIGQTSAGAVVVNTAIIVVITYDSATGAWAIRANGSATASGTNVQTFSGVGTTRIGGVNDGYYYRGHLPELFAKSSVETDANLKKIEGKLAADWNLRSLLPSDHPYKVYAP